LKEKVFITKIVDYESLTVDSIYEGTKHFPSIINCRGKSILLKPNMVEYDPHFSINTDPRFIDVLITFFQDLGAREVFVGEGPGHRRDIHNLLYQTGLERILKKRNVEFIDLNSCNIQPIPNLGGFTNLEEFYIGGMGLDIDVIISLPKLKTHHFTGITCSIKNLLGMAAGTVYGWPKNLFHIIGLDKSIADLFVSIKPHFAIVDGVVAMEGNGPLHGESVQFGLIIMGDNLPAVDAICAGLIGLDPLKIDYLKLIETKGFPLRIESICQLGETVDQCKRRFNLLPIMERYR
jgi:uncharacterized protein (DUF362 family)